MHNRDQTFKWEWVITHIKRGGGANAFNVNLAKMNKLKKKTRGQYALTVTGVPLPMHELYMHSIKLHSGVKKIIIL